MRISDWSSDVCSSDLDVAVDHSRPAFEDGLRGFLVLRRGLDDVAELQIDPLGLDDHRVLDEALHVGVRTAAVGGVRAAGEAPVKIGRASGRERVCQYG